MWTTINSIPHKNLTLREMSEALRLIGLQLEVQLRALTDQLLALANHDINDMGWAVLIGFLMMNMTTLQREIRRIRVALLTTRLT